MNRDIKFRALKDDMSNCNFVYGQLVYDAIGTPRITQVDRSGEGLTFHTCINGTEGQYTGLKDKNGKEIYEGDILHGGMSKNGVVKFGNGTFTIWDEPIGWDIDSFEERPEPLSTENWAVIIGNIYENPELLTEKSLT